MNMNLDMVANCCYLNRNVRPMNINCPAKPGRCGMNSFREIKVLKISNYGPTLKRYKTGFPVCEVIAHFRICSVLLEESTAEIWTL